MARSDGPPAPIEAFPRSLPGRIPGPAPVWQRCDDRFACRGAAPADATRLLTIEDGDESWTICAGAPVGDDEVVAVYARAGGGALAVPTGRLWVRFAEDDRAESHRATLARSGLEIVSIPPWAEHAAWVRARADSLSESLRRGIDAAADLAAAHGASLVEPQMLMESARRD